MDTIAEWIGTVMLIITVWIFIDVALIAAWMRIRNKGDHDSW